VKKVILILSLILSCAGCIHEGPHSGCDCCNCENEPLNLIFTYDGTTADFDRLVAGDIELYLYDSEGKKIEKRDIPYKYIKGGKPYSLEQQYAGNTYLVAWALPESESTNKIPITFLDEEEYSTVRFIMNVWPMQQSQRQSRKQSQEQSPIYSGSTQELFLERLTFAQNPLEEKTIEVDVKKILCTITVTIEEADGFRTQYPGEIRMNIDGASHSYKVAEDSQSGDRITIEDEFYYVENRNEYLSKNKVMPASVDSKTGLEDNIIVTLWEDGTARLMVDTGVKARKGTQIDVIIRPTKMEAIITVDSWEVRKVLVAL
jgi:hypothetical protein